jgi:hypothetical protein
MAFKKVVLLVNPSSGMENKPDPDPGSGINISDHLHWYRYWLLLSWALESVHFPPPVRSSPLPYFPTFDYTDTNDKQTVDKSISKNIILWVRKFFHSLLWSPNMKKKISVIIKIYVEFEKCDSSAMDRPVFHKLSLKALACRSFSFYSEPPAFFWIFLSCDRPLNCEVRPASCPLFFQLM